MEKTKIKLAEALLRRKELNDKIGMLHVIKERDLYEVKAQRVSVTDSLDDITAKVPKLTMSQVTHAYDWHSRRMRLIDAAIQQANWTTELEIDADIMGDYPDPGVK